MTNFDKFSDFENFQNFPKGSCTLHKSFKHIVDIFGFATRTREKINSNKTV